MISPFHPRRRAQHRMPYSCPRHFRRLLAGLAVLAVVTTVITTVITTAAAGVADSRDWPQFLGTSRDGVYAGGDVTTNWPAGGPAVLWKRAVGQGFAGPAVSGGKLILFHRVGDKETVECLDAESGKTIWSADYPTQYRDDFGFDEGPRATPTIADGKVYTFGAEGMLSCWDLSTGKKVWAVDTKAKFLADKGFFGMVCSPLVEGKVVVVNVGGGKGSGIVALDKENGKVLWTATDDEAGYASPIADTLNGKWRILSFTRAGLVALDPENGKVLFEFPWRSRSNASVNAATPLVIHEKADGKNGDSGKSEDLIFLSASYGTGAVLLKYDDAGPQKIWSGDESLSNHYATSVYRDGFLYGFHGRQEQGPSLRCVELKTGQVRWSEDGFGAGTVILAGDTLLILTEKGQLIAAPATPQGYKPVAHAQVLPFDCRAYPALSRGLFFARSKDKLVCLDLRKGNGNGKGDGK